MRSRPKILMSIKFLWVPSHKSLSGNEAADTLAKCFTNVPPSESILIPHTDFKQDFRKLSYVQTNLHCITESQHKGIRYFQNYYNNSAKTWFAKYSYSRNFIVTINRCRADHYNLAASLARIKIINSPLCECNEYEEDLNHLVWQCCLYNSQRAILIEKLRKLKMTLPQCVNNLLCKSNASICKYIFEFANSCKKSL